MKILSFDIGGTFTKLAIININKQKYQIIFKDKYLTCQCGNEGIQIFNGIALKAKELASRYAFKAIALSITGIVDSKKKIVITPSYVFKHFHMLAIEKIINKHIHLPVYCANDARCALWGEKTFGVLKNNQSDSLMVVIGTGIGTALMINHQIYQGMCHSAGEGGLLFSNENNWTYQSNISNLIQSAQKIDKHLNTAEGILQRAKNNHLTNKIVDQWYRGLARGLNSYCYIINPHNIVLGGGIIESKHFDLKRLKIWMLKLAVEPKLPIKNVKLFKAKLGNTAALIGAATLVIK